jgi:hypothetical protein
MAAPNTTTSQSSVDNPEIVMIPIMGLANLANSQVYKVTIPYAFYVSSALFRVGKPVTTAAKAATATVQINGTAVTGGVMALTSAATGTTGLAVAATAITGNNSTTTVSTTLEVAISSVTAFAEGDGWFEITILPTSAG